MSKILAIVFIIAGLGIILTYQNCGQAKAPNSAELTNSSVTVTGTVQKSTLDGCNTLIVSDADGSSRFIPVGIDVNQLIEGQKVTVTGHTPEDVYTTCMAGVVLKVEKIEDAAGAGQ